MARIAKDMHHLNAYYVSQGATPLPKTKTHRVTKMTTNITAKLKSVLNTQAKVGMIVHAYGARFRIREVRNYALSNSNSLQGVQNVAVNIADWIDGKEEPNFFGKNLPWNFQGNANAVIFVEQ